MGRDHNIESIFIGLRRAWHPPSAAIETSFTRLTRALAEIYATLGSDPDLAPLHAEIYRDFPGLAAAPPPEPADRRQLSDRRAAGADTTVKTFYLCSSLIQLMEDVYLDLELEREHRHPDNRGWMNLFGHWASSDTFRRAWALTATTYGGRFQEFCRRRFNLTLGTTDLVSLWDARYSRYSEDGPLADPRVSSVLEDAERRLVRMVTSRYIRGERNRIAERVRQVMLCRLRVPLGAAARLGVGRGALPLGERGDELRVPFGIAIIAGDSRYAPTIDRERADDRDDDGRLLTLRVRRHLRDQRLGWKALVDLVERMGIEHTAPPTAAEMRALGLAPGAGATIDSMFKSVLNDLALREQSVHPLAGNPVFGPLPRLPYSGVVRPREATWAHAVAFIYWILVCTDSDVDDVEVEAVLRAMRAWAGEHVEDDEIAFAVREARGWYDTAKRPVTALWPEVRAIVKEIKRQGWFGDERRAAFRAGLEQIAWADATRDREEARLIAKIQEWLAPEKKEETGNAETGEEPPADEEEPR